MLRALYDLVCAERRSHYLKLNDWIDFLQACGIIGEWYNGTLCAEIIEIAVTRVLCLQVCYVTKCHVVS